MSQTTSSSHMLEFLRNEKQGGGWGGGWFFYWNVSRFSWLFRPRGECGFFAQWQDPLLKTGSGVRIGCFLRRAFSRLSSASSCGAAPAGINPGVTDCQPALLQTLPPSTRNCQEGFFLMEEHSFTFSELRHKCTRQLEMQSPLPSERNFTEHQQTGHTLPWL